MENENMTANEFEEIIENEELEIQDTFNEDEIDELVEDETVIENVEEIEEVIDNGNENE